MTQQIDSCFTNGKEEHQNKKDQILIKLFFIVVYLKVDQFKNYSVGKKFSIFLCLVWG